MQGLPKNSYQDSACSKKSLGKNQVEVVSENEISEI
jgi:hypothetical protein